MANKLTKEKIDLLIEQVMNEDFSLDTSDLRTILQQKYVDDTTVSATGKSELSTDISSHKAVKDIAALKDPDGILSSADLQYIKDNIDNPEIMNTEIMRQLIALKYATKNDDLKKEIIAILDKRDELIQDKSKDRQSFSQPQIRTVPAESGQYTGNIEPMLDVIFEGTPKIKARMEKISQISKLFYSAAEGNDKSIKQLKNLAPTKFLAYVSLMDYFVEVTKSFDSGSGAYLFEWFLAMVAGGKVTGKESGPGGGMGAVDFEGAAGIGRGSAKYYQKKSDIKQAATGFKTDELVHYIVALKKQDRLQIGKTSLGTSDPSKLTMVDIYAPKVKKINDTEFMINKTPVTIETPTSKVPIGDHLGELVDTIYIAQVPTKSFRDMVYKSVSSSLTKKKRELLETFENFFTQLEIADEKCREYSVTGKIDDATATFTALDQAGDEFDQLIPKVNPGNGLQENKTKSLKELDKLIEHVILNKMNK